MYIYLFIFIARLDILDQVSEAPKMYVVAAAEVVRRRKFSSQFLRVRFKSLSSRADPGGQRGADELVLICVDERNSISPPPAHLPVR